MTQTQIATQEQIDALNARMEQVWQENGHDIDRAIDVVEREFHLVSVQTSTSEPENYGVDLELFRMSTGELVNCWRVSPIANGDDSIDGFGFDDQVELHENN